MKYNYKKEVIYKAIDSLLTTTPLPIAYGREVIDGITMRWSSLTGRNPSV